MNPYQDVNSLLILGRESANFEVKSDYPNLRALDKMKKECFSTKKLDWEIGADWEFKWKSSINQYVEAFLKTEIPRFPKVQ